MFIWLAFRYNGYWWKWLLPHLALRGLCLFTQLLDLTLNQYASMEMVGNVMFIFVQCLQIMQDFYNI